MADWYVTHENAQDLQEALNLQELVDVTEVQDVIKEAGADGGQRMTYEQIVDQLMTELVNTRKISLQHLYRI